MEKSLYTHSNRPYLIFYDPLDLEDYTYDIRSKSSVKNTKSCKSAKSSRKRHLSTLRGKQSKIGPTEKDRFLQSDFTEEDLEFYECPAEVNFTCGDDEEVREDSSTMPSLKDIICMQLSENKDLFPDYVTSEYTSFVIDSELPAGSISEEEFATLWEELTILFDQNNDNQISVDEFESQCITGNASTANSTSTANITKL